MADFTIEQREDGRFYILNTKNAVIQWFHTEENAKLFIDQRLNEFRIKDAYAEQRRDLDAQYRLLDNREREDLSFAEYAKERWS